VTTAASNSRDYYLISTESGFSCTLNSCQGTFASPYDDINLIFEHIQDVFLLGQKTEATINIYLMKKTSSGGSSTLTLNSLREKEFSVRWGGVGFHFPLYF